MGTPEFPDLGKHCSVDDCKQIDFLPFTCDRCTQVFCLDHRSYKNHNCPKGDVTVVISPLCSNGVRLNPDEDPNITWEKHVNYDCDLLTSNERTVKKKKKCPVPRCRELLTFSNTITCRDCSVEHCLKHRFGPDHGCAGPKKPESRWSSLLSSAEASISRLGNDLSEKLQFSSSGNVEGNGKRSCGKITVDVCPKCSRGFRDPVDLLKHIDEDHHGTSSKALDIL